MMGAFGSSLQRTKFLLDDLENLLLVKLLRETLHSGQSLTSITLYIFVSNCAFRVHVLLPLSVTPYGGRL